HLGSVGRRAAGLAREDRRTRRLETGLLPAPCLDLLDGAPLIEQADLAALRTHPVTQRLGAGHVDLARFVADDPVAARTGNGHQPARTSIPSHFAGNTSSVPSVRTSRLLPR